MRQLSTLQRVQSLIPLDLIDRHERKQLQRIRCRPRRISMPLAVLGRIALIFSLSRGRTILTACRLRARGKGGAKFDQTDATEALAFGFLAFG